MGPHGCGLRKRPPFPSFPPEHSPHPGLSTGPWHITSTRLPVIASSRMLVQQRWKQRNILDVDFWTTLVTDWWFTHPIPIPRICLSSQSIIPSLLQKHYNDKYQQPQIDMAYDWCFDMFWQTLIWCNLTIRPSQSDTQATCCHHSLRWCRFSTSLARFYRVGRLYIANFEAAKNCSQTWSQKSIIDGSNMFKSTNKTTHLGD